MPSRDPPRRIQKALFQEVGSRCPLCGEDDVGKLVVHHIEPWREVKSHDPEKMIVLCANCHAKAEAGDVSKTELYDAKRGRRVIKFPGAPSVMQNVTGHGNVVAGRDVNIRVPRNSRRAAFPRAAGTVCDDSRKVGYLQYLAKRYNQFRAWDAKRKGEEFKGGFIHGEYARKIKYAIRTTPLDQFERGVEFLQTRILKTFIGRNMNARGQRVFSSLDEFDGQGDMSEPGFD